MTLEVKVDDQAEVLAGLDKGEYEAITTSSQGLWMSWCIWLWNWVSLKPWN